MWRTEFDTTPAERNMTAYRNGKAVKLTSEAIDREMETYPRSRSVIALNSLTQEGLEHFVSHYGSTYRAIRLSREGGVKDLSPLGDLPELEHVALHAQRCERLWDMSRNGKLRVLVIDSCRKLTAQPCMLETAPALETVWYLGGAESTHPMASLQGFANLPAIREIRLEDVRLLDRSLEFLASIPTLEVFDFEPQMFTTEEIAWMKARYPDLGGEFLRAYGPAYPGSDSWVRVSGSRKPELRLPEDQEKLEQYVRSFDTLVRKYQDEMERTNAT